MPSEYKPNLGPITLTASTTLNVDAYAGKTIVLNNTAGLTITLPSATGSGACFKIVVGATAATGNYVIQVTTTDVMAGAVAVATDIAGVTCPTAATSDTITMTGTTTGGVIGSTIELEDIKSGVWAVGGALVSTGVEATPFSAAVS